MLDEKKNLWTHFQTTTQTLRDHASVRGEHNKAQGRADSASKQNSATGTRARVARVRDEHPDQLDYTCIFLNRAGWGEPCPLRRWDGSGKG